MASKLSRELALLLTGKDVSWSKTTKGAEKSMSRLHDTGVKAGKNMARNLEKAVVIGGAAAVAGGAFAIKQAMDFESSSASVAKTVDGNVTAILDANRALAKHTGLEVNALNEISATAGALGVAKDDIDDFTKTVAVLGVTTDDVTTDLGATSLGHLKTTLKLAGQDFEHLGNDLVFLGNNGASTEGQILSMAENIAGAAATVGASTPQVLGWAAAVANTGEEAEAGGSSIQRFWLQSFKSVAKGSDLLRVMRKDGKLTRAELDKLGNTNLGKMAEVTGMTAEAFSKAFGKDATGTLAKFVVGLGKLSKAEQLATLEALGFKDIRITRALLKLLGNTDNLTESLRDSEKGWEDNSAAQIEADKRFATTASKVAILKANVNDAAITIGTQLLPVLAELSTDAVGWIDDHQADIAEFSRDLASGVRDAVTWAKSLDWELIASSLHAAGQGALTIAQAIGGLDPSILSALGALFVANKFTGGAVMDLGGIVGGKAFDMFAGRGSSPANPLWVQSVGGLPGGPGLPGAGAAGGAALGLGTTLIGVAGAAVIGGLIAEAITVPLSTLIDPEGQRAAEEGRSLGNRDPRRFNKDGQVTQNYLPRIAASVDKTQDVYSEGMRVAVSATDRLQAKVSSGMEGMRAAARDTERAARTAGQEAAFAIRDKDLSVSVNTTVRADVTVSSREVGHAIVVKQIRSGNMFDQGFGGQ